LLNAWPFQKVERQLKDLTDQQRESEKTKSGSARDTAALVVRLFREDGYGFIKSLNDEEICFHRNSLLNDAFDRLDM